MRTPTWDEVEAFLRFDRWEGVRETDHAFFRKTLSDGRVLQTHRSFSSQKTMSEGRFSAILRTQLECSADDFWETIRSGRPVQRPSAPPLPEPQYPVWAVRVLQNQQHMTDEEIRALSLEEAVRLAQELWSRPPDPG